MRTYKESPNVRKWVGKYLKSNPHLSLEDVARRYYTDDSGHKHNLYFTDGFHTQCCKMLQEKDLCATNNEQVTPPQEAKDTGALCFSFQQRGKKPTRGELLVTLDGENLMLDSFNIAKDNLRRRFINRLYRACPSRMLNPYPFPKASLTQCLMEMAVEASRWGELPAKKVKAQSGKVLNRFDFEEMLAQYNNDHREIPPCHIERTVQRGT